MIHYTQTVSRSLTVLLSQLFLLISSLNDVLSFTDTSRHGAATAPRYLFRMVFPLASLIALADILINVLIGTEEI